jgi:hypothetical protein
MFLAPCAPPAHAQIPIPFGQGSQSGAKKLAKAGPTIAATFNPSDFTFDALVQSNWPLFFDYEIEQTGHVRLIIKVNKSPMRKNAIGASEFSQVYAVV